MFSRSAGLARAKHIALRQVNPERNQSAVVALVQLSLVLLTHEFLVDVTAHNAGVPIRG